MTDILKLFILLFFYSCIFSVPISLSANRKKSGLPVYWWLLLLSFMVELSLLCIMLSLTKNIKEKQFLIYAAPISAAVLAGIFYHYLSKLRDNKSREYE